MVQNPSDKPEATGPASPTPASPQPASPQPASPQPASPQPVPGVPTPVSTTPSSPAAPITPEPSAAGAPPPAATPPTPERWAPTWRDTVKRLAGVVAVIVLVWLLYLFLSSFLPRWWAQVIGNAVDGSFAAGAWWGIVVGGVFTAVPVLFVGQAVLPRRSWQLRGAFVALAALFAVPNLLTLGIALGTSAAAHAGERILDVDGPAFRGGSAWGAVIGGIVALVIVTMSALYRRRGEQLRQLRAEQA